MTQESGFAQWPQHVDNIKFFENFNEDVVRGILKRKNEQELEKLAQVLQTASDEMVEIVFRTLGNLEKEKLDTRDEKEKFELSDKIRDANLNISDTTKGSEKFISIGTQNFQGREIEIKRQYIKNKSLEYIIYSEGENIGEFCWLFDKGNPFNFHRLIKYKNCGLGNAIFFLSKDLFKKLGKANLKARTFKKVNASWFFRQGFIPEKKSDITPELLMLEEKEFGPQDDLYFNQGVLKEGGIILTKKLKQDDSNTNQK